MKEELVELYMEYLEEIGNQRQKYGRHSVAEDAEKRLDLFLSFLCKNYC